MVSRRAWRVQAAVSYAYTLLAAGWVGISLSVGYWSGAFVGAAGVLTGVLCWHVGRWHLR
jgi:hypothetical protein